MCIEQYLVCSNSVRSYICGEDQSYKFLFKKNTANIYYYKIKSTWLFTSARGRSRSLVLHMLCPYGWIMTCGNFSLSETIGRMRNNIFGGPGPLMSGAAWLTFFLQSKSKYHELWKKFTKNMKGIKFISRNGLRNWNFQKKTF